MTIIHGSTTLLIVEYFKMQDNKSQEVIREEIHRL